MSISPSPRLRIVGTSGSGKTHLARRAAAALEVGMLELDAVFWAEGWTRRDVGEARDLIGRFVADHPEGWVVEGNWTSMLDGMLAPGTPGGADTFVWLDLPRPLVMRQVVARTLRRGIRREELWHGNRERVSSWLRWAPEENIVRWAWTSHARTAERMEERIARGTPVVRLRGRREVDAWLAGLGGSGRTVEG